MTAASLSGDRAAEFARVALANIRQEYPNDLRHMMSGPDDRPLPHELHPAFHGSFDWHSCVEMHWMLVRLLRYAADRFPADTLPEDEIRAVLDDHFSAYKINAEAKYLREWPTFSRPYGWGSALTLVHEVATWDDPDAKRWTDTLDPLAATVADLYVQWLPKATYPVRWGAHNNSAFGLSRALPCALHRASTGDGALLAAVTEAARRWFGEDVDYPAGYEPSGIDFLSPALVEAELMSSLLDAESFADWLDWFMPGLSAGRPPALFNPATVSDPTDGHIGLLHGLNLSRAWAWRRLAAALPDDDERVPLMRAAADRHIAVSLGEATGGHADSRSTVEHWLAPYAVLLLT